MQLAAAGSMSSNTPALSGTSDCAVITILLCTFNGERFLAEQLNSISAQTYTHWRLVVSDDGSSDATCSVLKDFTERPENRGRVEFRNGAQQGAVMNFLSLATDKTIRGTYFAYCDQDDIWLPDKIERALIWFSAQPLAVPGLYCSRTATVTPEGHRVGLSPLFRKAPSFNNALVQSLAGGNTMVFNEAARALLVAAGTCDVVAHDWWTYMLVSGAGGTVHYDQVPSLAYRQHEGNQVGANQGLQAACVRGWMVLSGQWINWNDRNIAALRRNAILLIPQNLEALDSFCTLRHAPLHKKLRLWRRIGVYRQTILGQLSLVIGLMLRRF
jgi:glycosyltransferase involved in cell wall biosynthesis